MVRSLLWLLVVGSIMESNGFTPFVHHYLSLPQAERKRVYSVQHNEQGSRLSLDVRLL